MDAFPAFFPLSGRIVVIAGDGEAAEAKARLFEGSPAEIRRVAGEAAREPVAYQGAALAFVAVPDEGLAQACAAAAQAAGVPVNVVDRPGLCDFTTPAVIDRGEVVVGIGTGGASPMLATMLRHDIEALAPEGLGRVAALFRTMQDEVRAALPDLPARRAFLRAALTGPAARTALGGDMAGAQAELRQALAAGVAMRGVVQFLDGRGPAELLTLKASRALAAADVLAIGDGVSGEVLALARRDAERLAEATPEALAEAAARGLRVMRLSVPDDSLVRAVRALGADVELLPIGAERPSGV